MARPVLAYLNITTRLPQTLQSGFQHTPCISVLRILRDLCQCPVPPCPMSINPICVICVMHNGNWNRGTTWIFLFVYEYFTSRVLCSSYIHRSFCFGSPKCLFSWFLDRSKADNSIILSRTSVLIIRDNMCYVLSSIRHFNPTNNSINFPSTIIISHQIDDTWLTWHTLNSGQNIYFQHWMNLNINIYPQLMRHLQPGINC